MTKAASPTLPDETAMLSNKNERKKDKSGRMEMIATRSHKAARFGFLFLLPCCNRYQAEDQMQEY